jgi:hypothetical protein
MTAIAGLLLEAEAAGDVHAIHVAVARSPALRSSPQRRTQEPACAIRNRTR